MFILLDRLEKKGAGINAANIYFRRLTNTTKRAAWRQPLMYYMEGIVVGQERGWNHFPEDRVAGKYMNRRVDCNGEGIG